MQKTTYILVLDPSTACYLRDTARFPYPDANESLAYKTYFSVQAKRFATFAEAQDACPRGWPASRVVTEVTEVPAPSEEAVEAFVRGYVAAALWASVPLDEDADDDRALDARGFTARDIAPDSMFAAENDCRAFVTDNWATLREVLDDSYTERDAGQDFFLSRNGHGAGFFDRGSSSCWNDLQRAAKVWGETHATIDGDRCSIQ